MKKILCFLICLCIISTLLIGCNQNTQVEEKDTSDTQNSKPVDVNFVVVKGPTAVSIIKMLSDKPSLGNNVNINYMLEQSPDLMVSKVVSGEATIATLPTNVAVKLYNSGVPYKMVGINTWGLLYLAGTEDIQSWDDLKGKEVALFGKGATPDIITRYLLKQNDIIPEKDVSFKYYSGPQELAKAVIAEKNTIAVMPEPMLTMVLTKNEKVKVNIDIQDEWNKVMDSDKNYPMTSIMVKNDLINNNPDILENLLNEYKKSIEWINNNTKKAGIEGEKLDIGLKAKMIEKSIPRCNIKYIDAISVKQDLENYLNVLKEFNPKSIGGKLPDDEFYLQK